MSIQNFPFTIRVYGIFLQQEKVLVSDEFIFGRSITKFPGGGLHFGEGPADCIRREMLEETGLAFEVTGHFYTTDFFQPSAFHPELQVISIYYLVTTDQSTHLRISQNRFDFKELKDGAQSFRWMELNEINDDTFSLPIDRVVGDLLKEGLRNKVLKA